MNQEEHKQFVAELAEVLRSASPQLSDEERQWVRMAIQREAQTIKFRKAIIEKTLGGLIWAALVGLGFIMLDFLRNHGFRI